MQPSAVTDNEIYVKSKVADMSYEDLVTEHRHCEVHSFE
jgi:hypothetical protein